VWVGDRKMSTYDELEKEFNEKVETLRKNCKHPKVSGWLREEWAIAHGTGYYVKICEVCHVEVDRRK